MIVTGIQCYKCKDIIFSRAHHDWRPCSCKSSYVDGGFEYLRCGGDFEKTITLNIEVDATKKELYDDWNNYKRDKFGLLKGGGNTKYQRKVKDEDKNGIRVE